LNAEQETNLETRKKNLEQQKKELLAIKEKEYEKITDDNQKMLDEIAKRNKKGCCNIF